MKTIRVKQLSGKNGCDVTGREQYGQDGDPRAQRSKLLAKLSWLSLH